MIAHSRDLSGRGTSRTEDTHGTPTQSHVSPSKLVYEQNVSGWNVEDIEKQRFLGETLRDKKTTTSNKGSKGRRDKERKRQMEKGRRGEKEKKRQGQRDRGTKEQKLFRRRVT